MLMKTTKCLGSFFLSNLENDFLVFILAEKRVNCSTQDASEAFAEECRDFSEMLASIFLGPQVPSLTHFLCIKLFYKMS